MKEYALELQKADPVKLVMIANKVRRMTAPPKEPGRVTRPATRT
jgi:hypothetical protein